MSLARILFLFFFTNGHIHNVVSTLPNVEEIDVKNDNVVSTLTNVQIKRRNGQRWFDIAQHCRFQRYVHNVVSTLIWHCPMSRRHINLKRTSKKRWDVCWINTFSLTRTKSTTTSITDIHCINHTIPRLFVHSNIIWSAFRTRGHFCFFCSFED